ncbi:response regulator [Ruminococcus sp. AF21-42]|uniref:Stage 0 sporulation protein A homolog n=1 Tax=Blautia luti DSM 14534 = JCM 17040 TaxID=649762 RepID=A0A844GN21_9FIRM|nr:response regulator [Blautia luti DSM 14534 = JCM 17040]RHQ88911.1 response regulator [Ruminococcus sp. AF21-42]
MRSLERPDAKKIPVFAMTANAFIEDKQRSKEVGMNEHLSKPLDEKTLLDMIWKYMSERRNFRGC